VLAIRDEIRRYVVLSEHEALAAALWALHTHAVDAAFIAPILAIRSPQKRCGKSTLLDVLRSLVRRGLLVNSVSTAVVYRAMDMYRPTLLIDEADSFLDENEELRGIINGGHSRATAKTLRIGGANRDKVEVFDGFGPKAIAGIGKRKDTISDRAIQITMRRRRPDEAVEPLRQDRLDNRQLQSLAAAWTAASMAELQCADPAIPESLHDRAADNWRPLLAIADLCRLGDEARRAAVALTGTDDGAAGVIMLEDIRRLFVDQKLDRMSSAFTVEQLAELEDRPWPEWKQGKPITPRQLARLLEQFEIAPKLLKIAGATVRGYRLEQFADAFARYLGDSALPSVTPLPANNCAESGASDSVTDRATVTDRSVTATEPVADHKTLKASNDAAGNGVTDRNGAGTAWSEP
jgi:putative DNA primase/helicase